MPTDTLKRFTRPELISMLTEARVDRNHDKRKLWAKAIDSLLDQLNDR